MTFAEAVESVELGSPHPAEPVSPMCVTTPAVEAPSVLVEHILPGCVAENAAPVSALLLSVMAPVVDVPPVVVEKVQPAPVNELYVPVPTQRWLQWFKTSLQHPP